MIKVRNVEEIGRSHNKQWFQIDIESNKKTYSIKQVSVTAEFDDFFGEWIFRGLPSNLSVAMVKACHSILVKLNTDTKKRKKL